MHGVARGSNILRCNPLLISLNLTMQHFFLATSVPSVMHLDGDARESHDTHGKMLVRVVRQTATDMQQGLEDTNSDVWSHILQQLQNFPRIKRRETGFNGTKHR